jgi:hypothetical protein
MKFEIGDKVRFMSEQGGGVIRRFTSKDLAIVEIEEGFEIPVRISELVVARDNFREEDIGKSRRPDTGKQDVNLIFTSNTSDDRRSLKKKSDPGKDPLHLWLAFVPRNPESLGGSIIDMFLVNDSKYHLLFNCCQEQSGVNRLVTEGNLDPEIQEHLAAFHQNDLEKLNAFYIQALLYHKGEFSRVEPVDIRIDISEIQFHKEKHFRENDYFESHALLYELVQPVHENEASLKINPQNRKIEGKDLVSAPGHVKKGDTYEVDLHAEVLTDHVNMLTPVEILNLQMSRFNAFMNIAQEQHWKKIVFIHGVGDGRLQFELRKVIDRKYPDATYQDASFLEYGYGAMLVILV